MTVCRTTAECVRERDAGQNACGKRTQHTYKLWDVAATAAAGWDIHRDYTNIYI